MKKYKLIREYPGSPELGKEIDLSKIECDKIAGYNYIDEKWEIYKKDIINNPEFWEKVVEKDFEILQLIYNNGFIACFSNGKSVIYTDVDVETFLKKEDWKIYSVKRKSDNVQFKIGDRIKEGTIIKIIIKKDKIYLEV